MDFRNSAASSSPQVLRSATSLLACSEANFVRVGVKYGFFFWSCDSIYLLFLLDSPEFVTVPHHPTTHFDSVTKPERTWINQIELWDLNSVMLELRSAMHEARRKPEEQRTIRILQFLAGIQGILRLSGKSRQPWILAAALILSRWML